MFKNKLEFYMAGRIHFSLFILLTLLGMVLPFTLNSELKSDMKESIDDLHRYKNVFNHREDQISFAKEYFKGILDKKITILNFNYYSAQNNEVFFIYPGYGSQYWDSSMSANIEQPQLLQLYQFTPGDEVTVKGYKIKSGDDLFLYAKDILVQVQHKDKILDIPLVLFEKEILNPIKNVIMPNYDIYPKEKTTICENILSKGNAKIDPKNMYPSDKNEAFKEIKEKYAYAKTNNPYLKNMGDLYLNQQENVYCLNMSATSEKEFFSLRINQRFIFKPLYK